MIDFEDDMYISALEKKKNIIKVNLFKGMDIEYISQLSLKEIISQIPAFEDYSLNEIESELENIGDENISMERKEDKIQLKYKLTILKKEKYLTFDLIPKDKYVENEDDKDDYTYTEEEKDKIISDLKKEIEAQNLEIKKIENDIKEAERIKTTLEFEVSIKEEQLKF